MSSRVGSISDNCIGGSYASRASKAALNSIGKSIVVVLMHPEYVKMGLDTSGETHKMKEAVEPEEAAGEVVGGDASERVGGDGRFWHRHGCELEW